MDLYVEIARKIIEQQELIIGPVAIEQAKRVPGISIDWPKHVITLPGDEAGAIDELVRQYEHLFGRLSVEVCKDAAASLLAQLPPDKKPKLLR